MRSTTSFAFISASLFLSMSSSAFFIFLYSPSYTVTVSSAFFVAVAYFVAIQDKFYQQNNSIQKQLICSYSLVASTTIVSVLWIFVLLQALPPHVSTL